MLYLFYSVELTKFVRMTHARDITGKIEPEIFNTKSEVTLMAKELGKDQRLVISVKSIVCFPSLLRVCCENHIIKMFENWISHRHMYYNDLYCWKIDEKQIIITIPLIDFMMVSVFLVFSFFLIIVPQIHVYINT